MNNKKIFKLISKLLEIAGDHFSNHGCMELPDDFFEDWDQEEIKGLYKMWHEWNGDPEEFDENQSGYLGDWMLMEFFGDWLKYKIYLRKVRR